MVIYGHDSTLVFLYTCGELAASVAHIGAGTLSARDAIHDIPPPLRGKGVLHVHHCFSIRFHWLMGDVEVVGS